MNSFDILSVYGQFPTLGLLDNMVYDAIPMVTSAIGNTTINATIFNVDCAAVPSAPQTGSGVLTPFYIQADQFTSVQVQIPC